MSEKRFKVSIDSNNGVGLFDDSSTLFFIKFTDKEDAISCKNALMHYCNLMNELHEENEHQREEIINSHKAYVECLNEIKDLKEENDQLKEKLSFLEDFLESIKITSDSDEHLDVNLLQLLTEDETYFSEYLRKQIGYDDGLCVFNPDAKYPCKAYDECLKRKGTDKPLPCMVNWMMGRSFENMIER